MEPAAAAARLAQYLGAGVLFGAPLFALYAPKAIGGASAGRSRLVFLGWPALVVLVLGALASLATQAASMTGEARAAFDPGTMGDVLTGTAFGRGLSGRLAFASAIALVLAAAPKTGRGRGFAAVLTLCGAGALASFAWTGHGTEGDGAAGLAHLVADVAHLLAAGAWLGALAVLTLLLSRREMAVEAGEGLARFSGVGPGVVAILAVTGLVNGWVLIGLDAFWGAWRTPYGAVLIVKLALFALMLGLAGLNRWRLGPQLSGASSDRERALAAARASIVAETILGVAVLASVALLGVLPPPSVS